MALDDAKNFAKVTVSTGYDAAATSVALISGSGAKLPTAPFNLVWYNSTDYPDPSDDPNVEIVRCTLISTDTLTITRAQESTSATVKNVAGKTYKMLAGLTAKVFNTDIPGLIGSVTIKSITSGAIDNSNVTFGFAAKPKVVVVNGIMYRENNGWTWNAGPSTATISNPVGVGGDIYGI